MDSATAHHHSAKAGTQLRLIVPTVRSTAETGKPFALRALVLAPATLPVAGVTFYTKPLGSGSDSKDGLGPFTAHIASRVAADRNVFTVSLPAAVTAADFEWYAQSTGGPTGGVFPAGAPAVTQSVVVD